MGTAYHAGARADAARAAGETKFGIPLDCLGFEHLKLQYVSHFFCLLRRLFDILKLIRVPLRKISNGRAILECFKLKSLGPWRDMSGYGNRVFGNGHVMKKSITYTAPNIRSSMAFDAGLIA
ncbi:MAG TPA: hypothetical protein VG759_22775 [Candidatus Angelobacter sp.]|nr:hypothetical protein [Candidatus Angelobacter sp.]